MSLVTDTGKFTAQVDFALGASLASAATVDLGAATGNTITVTGTTTITSLGTASQAGVIRKVIFTDAVLLTHSASLICFGEANITTTAGDVAEFVATTTTVWRMIGFNKLGSTTNGLLDTDGLANGAVTSAKLGDAAIIDSKMKTRTVVPLIDTAATLTAAQLVNSGIFTAIPTADRIQTTDTALNIIAALPGYQVGTSFEFTIVNQAAFNETLAAGAGVTIVGSAVVNDGSATFVCRVKDASEVQIYRK